jgi:Transposase, Mutator family
MLTVIPGEGSGHEGGKKDGAASLIDEIVREGVRRMLAEALQAEVDTYIAQFAGERDENGRRLVVRNGHHQPREVLTSAGVIEVTVPRVNDKRIDPATGWNALREVFPGSREGRCWFHKTFATVRHRTKVTKGPGSRAAGLAMAFKLIESAQDRWRAVNASHLVGLVRAGATFINGKLVERTGAGAEHREAAA